MSPRHCDVLARRPRQVSYGGGSTTRLVCGYLACDAKLADMLLAVLPGLVRVNVRGSNAGSWLEASLRCALAEARSPRPGGAGVLAKLAELLFIEVLSLYINEQAEGRTGWLAGWRGRPDRRGCPKCDSPKPGTVMDAGRFGAHSRQLAVGTGRTLPARGGQLPDTVPDTVAHAARVQPAAQQRRAAGVYCRGGRLPDRNRVQPGFKREFGSPPAAWCKNQLAREPLH